jgi:threonine dehydrogenase-like Zn-dependent dehydrogenase
MAVAMLAKALGARKVYGTDASPFRLQYAIDKVVPPNQTAPRTSLNLSHPSGA